jgi:hypothetical protein
MRAEYDFSKGVRGKYVERFAKGSIAVVLEPDVAAEFRTAQSVNKALRKLIAPKKTKKTRPNKRLQLTGPRPSASLVSSGGGPRKRPAGSQRARS